MRPGRDTIYPAVRMNGAERAAVALIAVLSISLATAKSLYWLAGAGVYFSARLEWLYAAGATLALTESRPSCREILLDWRIRSALQVVGRGRLVPRRELCFPPSLPTLHLIGQRRRIVAVGDGHVLAHDLRQAGDAGQANAQFVVQARNKRVQIGWVAQLPHHGHGLPTYLCVRIGGQPFQRRCDPRRTR